MVDLLGHDNLGGKILLFFMDGLWGASFEHEPPVKFQMAPFNGDWTSSIFLSQDPVALSSVCLDILQNEFPKTADQDGGEGRHWDANFPACDDYLHQAADSENWPEGIVYDPENDGSPIGSLGVHEHWNNPVDRKYSRNLSTGNGIELIELTAASQDVKISQMLSRTFALYQNYPNPFNPETTIHYDLLQNGNVELKITDLLGRQVRELVNEERHAGHHQITWNGLDDAGRPVASGIYLYTLNTEGYAETRKLTLMR
jgi:hypothetical protein